MAIVKITGRIKEITPANHGDLFILGNTSNEADVGGWTITLMPDAGGAFAGGITILRRPEGKGADDNNVGFMPSPYRPIVINNVAANPDVFDSIALTGPSEVQVPANGTSIAFSVSCTAGSAAVYTRPLQGSTAI